MSNICKLATEAWQEALVSLCTFYYYSCAKISKHRQATCFWKLSIYVLIQEVHRWIISTHHSTHSMLHNFLYLHFFNVIASVLTKKGHLSPMLSIYPLLLVENKHEGRRHKRRVHHHIWTRHLSWSWAHSGMRNQER